MKRNSHISIGPGAASLILILVVLCMSILGMLSLVTARNDEKFSNRSIQVAEEIYSLHAEAETKYAEIADAASAAKKSSSDQQDYLDKLGAALPEDSFLEGEEISFDVTQGERILQCRLRVLPYESDRCIKWISYIMTKEAEEIWDW